MEVKLWVNILLISVFDAADAKDQQKHLIDPVEQLLKERGLKQPNHLTRRVEAGDEYGDTTAHHTGLINQLKNAQADLSECIQRRDELSKMFTKKIVNEALRDVPLETPYLKQVYRALLKTVLPTGRQGVPLAKVTFKIESESVEKIQECLQSKCQPHTCTNTLVGIFASGTIDEQSRLFSDFLNILSKIDLVYLQYFSVTVLFFLVIFYTARTLIAAKLTVYGMILLLATFAFVVSVPWEWMRLYKTALSRKAADQSLVSEECFQKKMSYGTLFKWWLRDTFSFDEDSCSKYYAAVIVDPIWEVTPSQALAAAASRMFFQPLLVLSEHLGKSFRVLFKEIPAQWHFLVFVAGCVVFLLSIGIQVYTPILHIGRRQNYVENGQIRQLKEKVETLEARLANKPAVGDRDAKAQVAGVAVEDIPPQNEIEPAPRENRLQPTLELPLPMENGGDSGRNHDSQLPVERRAVENVYEDPVRPAIH